MNDEPCKMMRIKTESKCEEKRGRCVLEHLWEFLEQAVRHMVDENFDSFEVRVKQGEERRKSRSSLKK